jgi:hypothetical protein
VSVVRSLQRVLGQSRVVLLAVLVAAVFFTAGFVELAVTRHQMQAQYAQALDRVDRTQRQNTLLQLQLERAQRGELLPWLAWEMYGKLPKGARGIETQPPAPVVEAGPVQPETPKWQTWLKSLGIN